MDALKLSLMVATFAGAVAAVFVAGQAVEARTHRLFAADDQRHESLIARSCGKHASLWRNAATGQYGCLYVNQDGAAIVNPVPDAPLLSARR